MAVKTHVFESRDLKLEKIPEALEKPQVKESSKGIRRLLKFGRKNHSSAAGEHNLESDSISINSSEADDSAIVTTASDEGNIAYATSLTTRIRIGDCHKHA